MTVGSTAGPVFEPAEISFGWTNEAWGLAFLPGVRVATRLLAKDELQLLALLKSVGIDPTAEMIEGLTRTTNELSQLLDFVRAANARVCIMSEVAFPETVDTMAAEAAHG